MQRNQRTKHLTYGLVAFLLLIFALWVMYVNYLTQLEVRERSVQRVEADFQRDSNNLTNFLLERQNSIRNLAIDRTVLTFFENKALGMTAKYGLNVSLNSIQKLLNGFQQQHVIAGKIIFPKLLFQDTQGRKLVLVESLLADSIAAQITTKVRLMVADRPVMTHDQDHPDFLKISAPCVFKKQIVGHLIAWIPYHILFDQFLKTSLSKNLERFLLFAGESYSIPIVAPFSKLDSNSAFSQKIRQAIDQQKKDYLCSVDQERYLIFFDRPAQLPFEIVKLLLRRNILGNHNPKMLFWGMVTVFSLLFMGMILSIQLSLKQQINAVKLAEAVELRRHIEQKNKELEAANKEIFASRQEAIREREHLNVTLRSIGDAVITTGLDKRIILINKVAEELTGWSQEEALGKPLSEIFHIINEKTGMPCEDPLDKVLASGKIIVLANHTVLISKDKMQISISKSAAPIHDLEGKTVGIVLVFRDVTAQKKTEEELLKIRKLESVGVLAGGIAHDFNNTLAAILGNISLALTIADPRDETYGLLVESEKASLRAKDLTQQLLTFAKGGEPVKKIAAIEEVIKDSAGFVLRGSNVRCDFEFGEELWPVAIDTGQISQVIQNIIVNASQAMSTGGIVVIDCSNCCFESSDLIPISSGNYLKIVIKDQGVGIPAGILDKIFDPYFTTKQKGSGLGLATTHSIIIKHDGYIVVNSKPGQGTTFTIYLPASQGRPELDQKNVIVSPVTGQGRIMIMDDEEMIRALVEKALSRIGYEVVLAKDGDDAVRLYQEAKEAGTPIDLIIMDLTIPGGMGGKDAVTEIHKIDPEAKVIVSSGYSNDPVMANFSEYGFCAAMVKPFQMRELMEVVGKTVSN